MKSFNFFKGRKVIQKGELRNVEVELVSLLFDEVNPANQKGFVVKSANGKNYKQKGGSKKYKSETQGTQGRLYVTLMEPEIKDSQGDFYNREEIQKACDHFSKNGMVGRNDINHNNHSVDDFIVAENYILKSEDKEHFPDTKIGSWVQVLKCDNLESPLWKKVVKGDFNGVSIYGRADEYSSSTETMEALNAIKAEFDKLKDLKKSVENDSGKSAFESGLKELEDKIKKLESDAGSAGIREAVKSIESSLVNLNQTMTKAISKSIQGEPMEKDNEEILINGEKIVLKSSHKEIYKGIADVDSGKTMNILTPNTTSLFIDQVIESKPGDTLADISVVPLIKDEKIDVGFVEDLVFKNSLDGALDPQDISSADLDCPTGILNAEFALGRDIVEFYKDKYGEDAFGAYVEQHIAKKAEKAIRHLLFKGDRTSDTAKLKALNGIIKKATDAGNVEVVDNTKTWAERFEDVLLGFTDEMLEEQENFKIYVSHRDLIKIRSELGKRETNKGDKLLLEGGNVSFSGIPVKARLMPDDYIIAGLPKFIIIGYRTDAELKVEHHGSDWKYHWYIRIRPGITYVPGFVNVYQLAEIVVEGGGV